MIYNRDIAIYVTLKRGYGVYRHVRQYFSYIGAVLTLKRRITCDSGS